MYAIVKTGGKQYKVAVGDVVEIEKLDAASGDEVTLPAILLVDAGAVTHDADKLAKVPVTAEVLAQTKGPKIRIHKFKNKTGYHKRMGHRQKLTQIKITGIGTDKAAKADNVDKVDKAAATDTAAKTTAATKAPAKAAAAKTPAKAAAAKAPAKAPAKAASDDTATDE